MLEIRNYLFRAVSDRIVTWLHAAQPPKKELRETTPEKADIIIKRAEVQKTV